MPFYPVGNAAEAVVKGEFLGQECVTTFGFLGTVDFTGPNVQELAEIVRSAWEVYCIPQCPGAYIAYEVKSKGLRSESDYEGSDAWPGGITGALLGSPMPGNVSLAVSRRTGRVGRSYRGRVFWPGFNEGDVVNNEVSSFRTAAIAAALNDFLAEVNTIALFVHGVISRQTNGGIRPVGVVNAIQSYVVVDRVVDSMRRRLPRRGN